MDARSAAEKYNQESAKYIINLFRGWRREYGGYPMSRQMNTIGHEGGKEKSSVEGILQEISKADAPEEMKYAAATLLKLEAKWRECNSMQEEYDAMLLALQDPKLKLEYTSLIFGMYCNKDYLRHVSQNNLLTRKAYPHRSSSEWRETMSQLQKHCFIKLKAELEGITDNAKKIEFLDNAVNRLHIFSWKEQSSMWNDGTGTDNYRTWIMNECARIAKLAPAKTV